SFLVWAIRGQKVAVPRMVGMEASRAVEEILKNGLTLTGIDDEYSEIIQPGCIIDQNPLPGTVVKRGRGIHLTKSKGMEELEIPSVVGQLAEDAENTLMRSGVRRGQRSDAYHDRVGKGRVVVQEPGAGVRGAKGDAVNILVSLGPRQSGYIMPNVLGMNRISAEERLRLCGFSRIDVREKTVLDEVAGVVLEQDPGQGALVYLSSPVLMTVSKASEQPQTPAPVIPDTPARVEPDLIHESQAMEEPTEPPPTQIPTLSVVKVRFLYPLPTPKGVGWVEVKMETRSGLQTVYTGVHSKGVLIEFEIFTQPGAVFTVYQDGKQIGTRKVE
ncbi:MAG TPA: PASTA domain-containing protein, partial [bacterium]|nr:PASTA domain-containing protein [bacterium]